MHTSACTRTGHTRNDGREVAVPNNANPGVGRGRPRLSASVSLQRQRARA